jgi:hypothetical protein
MHDASAAPASAAASPPPAPPPPPPPPRLQSPPVPTARRRTPGGNKTDVQLFVTHVPPHQWLQRTTMPAAGGASSPLDSIHSTPHRSIEHQLDALITPAACVCGGGASSFLCYQSLSWQLNALHVKTCEGLSNSPQMPDSGDDSSDDESKKLFRRLPAHLREQSMQKTYDLLNGGAATAYVPPVGTMPWGSDAREAM